MSNFTFCAGASDIARALFSHEINVKMISLVSKLFSLANIVFCPSESAKDREISLPFCE
jgi:hypothetical protein